MFKMKSFNHVIWYFIQVKPATDLAIPKILLSKFDCFLGTCISVQPNSTYQPRLIPTLLDPYLSKKVGFTLPNAGEPF